MGSRDPQLLAVLTSLQDDDDFFSDDTEPLEVEPELPEDNPFDGNGFEEAGQAGNEMDDDLPLEIETDANSFVPSDRVLLDEVDNELLIRTQRLTQATEAVIDEARSLAVDEPEYAVSLLKDALEYHSRVD